ncbi:MAG: betaine/proline/choline family ABC transporter ATP-binding protein [Synergistales bacterium]|nr:betaine/proline/choline family ABC transporter ATP-binding protein [Synergistales bacterium]
MAEVKSMGEAVRISNLWKVYTREKSLKIAPEELENETRRKELEEKGSAVFAVQDVSFGVRPGEVFIVMGLSGSGKSTLIRCLLRLVEPTSGGITINGTDVTAMNTRELKHFRQTQTAMVFQHYGLLPHRSVLDNVAFGLKLRGIGRDQRNEKAKQAIAQVGLKGWESYYPASLSGGMRQRVGIARALVAESPVLLMDEPFSGLDPLIRREMQDELLRLQEEVHKTIFFVTHDLSEALRLGDRMAVMRRGRVVQVGAPDDIIADPADEYVAKFVQDEREQFTRAERHIVNKPDKQVAGGEW